MSKSEKEYEKIRSESKDKILSAAIEVFAKKGYAATNTSDIAETANISIGLMYRYFRSKQELFESITEFAIAGLIEITRYLNSDGNPKEIINDILESLLKEIDDEEFVNLNMTMIHGIISEGNPISQVILLNDIKMFEAMAGLIYRGQIEGMFKSGDSIAKASLLFSSIQGMVMMKFLLKEHFKVPSLSEITALLY